MEVELINESQHIEKAVVRDSKTEIIGIRVTKAEKDLLDKAACIADFSSTPAYIAEVMTEIAERDSERAINAFRQVDQAERNKSPEVAAATAALTTGAAAGAAGVLAIAGLLSAPVLGVIGTALTTLGMGLYSSKKHRK
jgi:glucose-6-phosphate dehydrogenase assembly protein OpcA